MPSPSQISIAASIKAVLSAVEMLEQILLRVDMHTLLVSASRVCHHWADLIKSSPSLQRKLFMSPCDAAFVKLLLSCDDTIHRYKHPDNDKVKNPVLGARIPSLFSARRALTDLDGSCFSHEPVDPRGVRRYTNNPIMLIRDFREPPLGPEVDWPALARIKDATCWQRPEASWRKMLVQQPPLQKLLIVSDVSNTEKAYWSCTVVHRPHLDERSPQPTPMSHGLCLRMEALYEHLVEIKTNSRLRPGRRSLVSWWVPQYPRLRARALVRQKDKCNLYRMDLERFDHASFEVVQSECTSLFRNSKEHFVWINENLTFNENDGADLILHSYSSLP